MDENARPLSCGPT
jgi:hypothetical protein